ncbi:MAG: nucleoside-diphosphate kinase [Deltaproteobacteria bacterium]|nr:nucleoside-diphosphate kinase [Deltaproteobacteria bacterium]
MAIERTLSIVKPNATARNLVGAIVKLLEEGGLRVVAMRMTRLTLAQARAFYEVHKARPFYGDLVEFMCSGPVVPMVLEGENAIQRNREIMGATDPKKAAAGTIRKLYGDDVQANAVHGSDAPETAAAEIAFFFPRSETL